MTIFDLLAVLAFVLAIIAFIRFWSAKPAGVLLPTAIMLLVIGYLMVYGQRCP